MKSQSLYPCSHSHLLERTYFLLTFEKFSMHLYTYTRNTFVLLKWDHTVMQPLLPHLIDFGLLSISACIPLSFTSCTESHCMCGPYLVKSPLIHISEVSSFAFVFCYEQICSEYPAILLKLTSF